MSVGLYIHIPFCLSRCAYCSFVSNLYDSTIADAYLDAMQNEIRLKNLETLSPSTIFLGGGTPSCLSKKQLEKLFSILPSFLTAQEMTCELNPDSADSEVLQILQDHGIDRCSFGVQSFSEKGLSLLGRRHDAKTAQKAVSKAANMKFRSVNIDLISAWPGQTTTLLEQDIGQAIDLGVSHLSCYNLIIDEASMFLQIIEKQGLVLPSDEEIGELWDCAEFRLEHCGFVHYETSNFSKPGYQCRHNVDNWRGEEYHGIGVAAHSHINGERIANTNDIYEYIDSLSAGRLPIGYSEKLDPIVKAKEYAVFWLRLFDGIDLTEFRQKAGIDFFELYKDESARLLKEGYLVQSESGNKLFVPKKYQPVLDSILIELV